MANELIPTSANLSVSKYGNEDAFKEVSSSSAFLPRLQLFGANSNAVKEGKMPMAHYGIVLGRDQFEDLGAEVEVVVISWRPRAMKIPKTEGSAPISFFNPTTAEFKQIQKESETPNSGSMFGPEFLIWVPSARRYATYFMSSATARRQAAEMRALIGKGATLKTQYIKTAQYSWHGPVVTVCLRDLQVPDLEEIKQEAEIFNNPEDSSVEFDPATLEGDGKENRAR